MSLCVVEIQHPLYKEVKVICFWRTDSYHSFWLSFSKSQNTVGVQYWVAAVPFHTISQVLTSVLKTELSTKADSICHAAASILQRNSWKPSMLIFLCSGSISLSSQLPPVCSFSFSTYLNWMSHMVFQWIWNLFKLNWKEKIQCLGL